MDDYLISYIPGMCLFILSDVQRKFLNCLGRTTLPMICFFVMTLLHYYWVHLFFDVFDLGLKGIGLAGTLTNGLSLIFILILSYFDTKVRPALFWPDHRCFYGLWEQLSLGLPIILNAFLDWVVFELSAFTAGYIGIFE